MENNLRKAQNYLEMNPIYIRFNKEEQEIIFSKISSELSIEFERIYSNDSNDEIYMKNVYKFIDDTLEEIYISINS